MCGEESFLNSGNILPRVNISNDLFSRLNKSLYLCSQQMVIPLGETLLVSISKQ